jgi:hypothetical protein
MKRSSVGCQIPALPPPEPLSCYDRIRRKRSTLRVRRWANFARYKNQRKEKLPTQRRMD